MSDAFRRIPDTAPRAPRELTPDIESDCFEEGRVLRLIGGIWTTFGLGIALLFSFLALALELRTYSLGAGLVSAFGLIGGALWMTGYWQRAVALRTYRDGVEVRATVTALSKDESVRVKGRSPFRLSYEYEANGRLTRGSALFFRRTPPRVEIGDRIAILHLGDRPGRSVVWTRFDHRLDPKKLPDSTAGVLAPHVAPTAQADESEEELELGEARARQRLSFENDWD